MIYDNSYWTHYLHGYLISINWKSAFRECESNKQPSEAVFQGHMERSLNPDDTKALQYTYEGDVWIPVLDDTFPLEELDHVVKKQVKPNKSCDPNGNSPEVVTTYLAALYFNSTQYNISGRNVSIELVHLEIYYVV